MSKGINKKGIFLSLVVILILLIAILALDRKRDTLVKEDNLSLLVNLEFSGKNKGEVKIKSVEVAEIEESTASIDFSTALGISIDETGEGFTAVSDIEIDRGKDPLVIEVVTENGDVLTSTRTGYPFDEVDLPFSTPLEHLVELEIPSGSKIAKVTLSNDEGLIDSKEIDFPKLLRLSQLLRAGAPTTSPANTSAPTRDLVIFVINEVRGGRPNDNKKAREAVDTITDRIKLVKNNIPTWTDFSDRIQVIPIKTNDRWLGCLTQKSGGLTLPVCPYGDTSKIKSIALSKYPNRRQLHRRSSIAVVVVYPQNASRGTTPVNRRGSAIADLTVVGYRASKNLLAHELGHSIGKMGDEFDTNNRNAYKGQNCFKTLGICRAETRSFPEASCEMGCNIPSNYRSANKLMRNINIRPIEYGSYEQCVLAQSIAFKIKENYSCVNDD